MCACSTFGMFVVVFSLFLGRSKLTRSGDLIECRSNVACRDPAQIAYLALVEGAAAMHRAAVVPDDQIALAPFVTIDKRGLGGARSGRATTGGRRAMASRRFPRRARRGRASCASTR